MRPKSACRTSTLASEGPSVHVTSISHSDPTFITKEKSLPRWGSSRAVESRSALQASSSPRSTHTSRRSFESARDFGESLSSLLRPPMTAEVKVMSDASPCPLPVGEGYPRVLLLVRSYYGSEAVLLRSAGSRRLELRAKSHRVP